MKNKLPSVIPFVGPEKRCSKCKQVKPATEEFFYKMESCAGGLDTTCIACIKANRDQRKMERLKYFFGKPY